MIRRAISGIACAALLGGCASGSADEPFVPDPYSNTNRKFHAFNKGFDRVALNPASKAYDFATPTLFKHMIGNAVSHLSLPALFANHLLQGDFRDAGETLARFTVNTVGGAGGFLDPATELGADYLYTDFGLTLADWGAPDGVYLELPVFGPASSRDAVGKVVDMAFAPTTWVDLGATEYAITAVEVIDTRDRYRAVIDEVLYDSEDSYISARNTYVQNRRRLLSGETDVEALPDIFDAPDDQVD